MYIYIYAYILVQIEETVIFVKNSINIYKQIINKHHLWKTSKKQRNHTL